MEGEAAERKLNRPSSAIQSFPRDLLRRLGGESCSGEQREASGGEEEEEVELNLGLSLGGCFGVDPEGKKLVRSSSIASFSLPRELDFLAVPRDLVRTSSLPSEAEEERRKRKELQGLRRLEAKKKRLSKRNSIKLGFAKPDEGGDGGKKTLAASMAANGFLDLPIGSQFKGVFSVSVPPGLPAWTAGPRSTAASHGSGGSQGSSSQEALVLERQTSAQDSTSTSTVPSASGHEAADHLASEVGGRLIASARGQHDANIERNMMGEMPCVFTRGDGPNGRRIEGFLYNYKKGEDVRIVCICHGSFLTPAEFVKHAGGGEVANPMRHIVVCSSPAAFRLKYGFLQSNWKSFKESCNFQSITISSDKMHVILRTICGSMDDQGLREAFSCFGEVVEARIIVDRETGWSKGFGFVTFTSDEEASSAISGMLRKDLRGGGGASGYSGGGGYGNFGGDNRGNGGNLGDYSGSGGSSDLGGGYSGRASAGFGSNANQYSSNFSSSNAAYGNENQNESFDEFKDDNDEPDDYANKRA